MSFDRPITAQEIAEGPWRQALRQRVVCLLSSSR